MADEEYKPFEQYGFYPRDFRIDTYRQYSDKENDIFVRGVKIEIPKLNISEYCHSEKTQIGNRNKCLQNMESILYNLINNGTSKDEESLRELLIRNREVLLGNRKAIDESLELIETMLNR